MVLKFEEATAAEYVKMAKAMMKRERNSAATKSFARRYTDLFGTTPNRTALVWNMLLEKELLEAGAKKEHLLWGLLILSSSLNNRMTSISSCCFLNFHHRSSTIWSSNATNTRCHAVAQSRAAPPCSKKQSSKIIDQSLRTRFSVQD